MECPKDTLELIQTTAVKAAGIASRHVDLNGDLYSNDPNFKHVPVPEDEQPDRVNVTTLTGLVDWYNAESPALADEKLLVHVTGAATVEVVGKIGGRHLTRKSHASATATDFVAGFTDVYQKQEEFIIGLLSRFLVDEDDRKAVLAYVGNLTEENIKTSVDNGIAQVVQVRSGIAGRVEVTLPSIVTLHPRRSFTEIGSVPEKYVLRLKQPGLTALFAADAGAWRVDTIQRIAAFLREKLPAATIIA